MPDQTKQETPSFLSYLAGYWVLSSAKIVGDSNADTTSRLAAAASLAAAGFAVYYVVGNPIEAVQSGDWMKLGMGYAAGTVTGYAVVQAGSMLNSSDN